MDDDEDDDENEEFALQLREHKKQLEKEILVTLRAEYEQKLAADTARQKASNSVIRYGDHEIFTWFLV